MNINTSRFQPQVAAKMAALQPAPAEQIAEASATIDTQDRFDGGAFGKAIGGMIGAGVGGIGGTLAGGVLAAATGQTGWALVGMLGGGLAVGVIGGGMYGSR